MNDISQSKNDSPQSELQCEFRSIPVTALSIPAHLFDNRIPEASVPPQMLIPLTVYGNGDVFTVIDGFKRLQYARTTGLSACNCTVVSPEPSPEHAALLRIKLNRGRPFHFLEKINYIKYFRKQCDDEGYENAVASIPFEKRERHDFEQLAGCDDAIIEAVSFERIDSYTALEINRSDEPDRTVLLTFFSRYRFSRQMQRELLDWILELVFREHSSVSELLSAGWLQEVEENRILNPPQKIERIRKVLFNRRFPTLSRAKKRWVELAAKYNPAPSRVQFKPSEAFEKNRLELKITITSAEEAHRIFHRFSEMKGEQWDQLIYPAQFSIDPGSTS
jgi:hypothetical protein